MMGGIVLHIRNICEYRTSWFIIELQVGPHVRHRMLSLKQYFLSSNKEDTGFLSLSLKI